MSHIPVVPYRLSSKPPDLVRRLVWVANGLKERVPGLQDTPLPRITREALQSAPRLLLEDGSSIREPELQRDTTSYLDRARLRAGDGDLVICPNPVPTAFEDYCQEYLALGRVEWLQPSGRGNRRHLAHFLEADREAWQRLVEWVKEKETVVIDPYVSNLDVWDMARRLRQETGSQVFVLGAPPALSDWVNHKVHFIETVWDLFGQDATPETRIAGSLQEIVQAVRELANSCQRVIVKMPDSAGGVGNISLPSEEVWRNSREHFQVRLEKELCSRRWTPGVETVISPWLRDILASPSVQTWIPLPGEDPVVEGVFEQKIVGWQGEFCGCKPALFPTHLLQRMVDQGWLLARLFQELGYLGRCSFDFLLEGDAIPSSRTLILECNGRWGGTSLPMTMMNRILGNWKSVSYTVSFCGGPDLKHLGFQEILGAMGNRIFDVRDHRGFLILFNPTRLDLGLGIEVLAMGKSPAQADQRLNRARQILSWIAKPRGTIWSQAPA